MKGNLRNSEEFWMAIITVLSALLIAASEATGGGLSKYLGNYAYWLVRILIEASLFVAVLYATEKVTTPSAARLPLYMISALLSLVAFTLAITSFDLILGLPELGLNESEPLPSSRLQAFGLELVYLLDNHIILCVLLLLPRWLLTKNQISKETKQAKLSSLFFAAIKPALKGHIYHIEAQEHYVRVVTTSETRMILYRFSDAIREMPDALGMQVHRSHWVAYTSVKNLVRDGQSLKLHLSDNETVPVSRSFRSPVEERFAENVQ